MTKWRTSACWLGGLSLLLAAGCEPEKPGDNYACECQFLTDTDDASTQRVEVCAAKPADAEAHAKGCAQSAAPAPVSGCSCAATTPSKPCKVGACQALERR